MIATFTIANGASLSGAVALDGQGVISITMPSAWTTANLTFSASVDGTTYGDVYDDGGTEVVVTAAASRAIVVPTAYLPVVGYLKIRSGTSGTPVAQGGARSLIVTARALA